jgi:hypothetical protein
MAFKFKLFSSVRTLLPTFTTTRLAWAKLNLWLVVITMFPVLEAISNPPEADWPPAFGGIGRSV